MTCRKAHWMRNQDGTVNVYDENGQKAGTMPKEEAEAMAVGVEVIVEENKAARTHQAYRRAKEKPVGGISYRLRDFAVPRGA